MTLYAVMYQGDDETYDFVVKDLEAHSPDDAARKAAELITLPGNYLVLPNRNAEPISVELERVPRAVVKKRKALAA